MLSRGFIDGKSLTYLIAEGIIMAVFLLAHWARLFRIVSLQRHPTQAKLQISYH
jgi:hypothetical protein